MKVISNSSPLINFSALKRLELLRTLYGTITIPEAVYREVVVVGRGRPSAALIEQAGWIIRAVVHTKTAVAALSALGSGEAEARVLAREPPGSLLLLDDRQARLAAGHLGVPVIGTLGVLLIAKQKGLIETLGPQIDRLQARVGFRISPELRTHILQAAGEHKK